KAVGQSLERGLMQLTRRTATRELGVVWEQAFNIHTNVDAGARYLMTLVERTQSVKKALRLYNGGGDEEYVTRVMRRYQSIDSALRGDVGACKVAF
ncbi:lytic transglycosylase domain-containing protein, partial [Candidatus Microgenomates bacterium]